jgi:hypothetical protein
MAIRKKTSTSAAPAKASTAAPVAPAAALAPVARSESKGSGTMTAKPGASAGKVPTYEQIAERAYQIYLKRGFGPGDAHSDWVEAERQLKAGK